jgi:hypothetical protein
MAMTGCRQAKNRLTDGRRSSVIRRLTIVRHSGRLSQSSSKPRLRWTGTWR